MTLLLDEMYPATLALSLKKVGIEATTVAALRLAGHADAEVLATAVAGGYAVLTENVGDFTRLAAGRRSPPRAVHRPCIPIFPTAGGDQRPCGSGQCGGRQAA